MRGANFGTNRNADPTTNRGNFGTNRIADPATNRDPTTNRGINFARTMRTSIGL